MDDTYPFVPRACRCDVRDAPTPLGGHRYVCEACGTEFTWRPEPTEHDARLLATSKRRRTS